MALNCEDCDRSFGTRRALQQHLRDSPAHAVTFDCDECDRAFDAEQALQQHLRDLLSHVNLPAAGVSQSFNLQPALHDEVLQSLRAYDLAFDFFAIDDSRGILKEHGTSIMATFTCTNRSCPTARWTSKQIAITIRQYPGGRYNARVYFQRCELCDSLSEPELDNSYAERISYRLAKWSGLAVEEPPVPVRCVRVLSLASRINTVSPQNKLVVDLTVCRHV